MGFSRTATIGQLCDDGIARIQTGPFGSQLHAHDYRPVGTPVIPTEAIGCRRIRNIDLPRVDDDVVERLARHKLFRGDILFARRGAQATGLSAIVESSFEGALCGTGAILLRIEDQTQVDPDYMSFALAVPSAIQWLKDHAVGAVMPNLNADVIRRLPLPIPPLNEQRAIAHILSTLDDKIELNRRTNETLESMARALFKSWFVDFDPVRAKAQGQTPPGMDPATAALFPSQFQDSELGEIPKGWTASVLEDAAELNPTRSLSKGALAPYVGMASLPTSGHRATDWSDREAGSGARFINGDTLLARITPCLENGKTGFVDFLSDGQVGWGSTEYIVIRPRPPLVPEWGYLLARDPVFRDYATQKMEGTTGRQRVPAAAIAKYAIVLPSREIGEAFGDAVTPLFKQMKALDEQGRTLGATRDALLPKLLSGELSVAQAERAAEATA